MEPAKEPAIKPAMEPANGPTIYKGFIRMTKLQAFERMGNITIALYGEDNADDNVLMEKIFINEKTALQLSHKEYLHELSISYSSCNGDNDPIDFDKE